MPSKRLLIVDDEPGFGEFVRRVAPTLNDEATIITHGQVFRNDAQDAKTRAAFMGLRTVTTLVKPIALAQWRATLSRQNSR
jgi:hypothetical protein